MVRYVSLSTDNNPHYAIYAPIVCRVWRRLGYEPILFVNEGFGSTPFGQFVVRHLPHTFTGPITVVQAKPLSLANTMRVVRLAGAACAIDGDCRVMTADIDMLPISRTFFEREGPMVLFRGDLHCDLAKAQQRGDGKGPAMLPGVFRIPMCYIALTAKIWREILPFFPSDGSLISSTTPQELLERMVFECPHDLSEWDEVYASRRILSSTYAIGSLEQIHGEDTWKQGDLTVVAVSGDPSQRPRHMILGNERWVGIVPIDWHMPRPARFWMGEEIARYWPEEADFIKSYWPEACALAGFG